MLRIFCGTMSLLLALSYGASAQQAPPAPSQDYDRFGVYHWTTTYEGYRRLRIDASLSCEDPLGNRQLIDTLIPGVELAASLGSRTLRLTLGNYGGRYSHGYEPGGECGGAPLTLKQWAQGAEFRHVFNDPRFTTYLLTIPTFDWAHSVTLNGQRYHAPPANYGHAYAQVRELVEYLVGQENGAFRFPGKTFILLNWEADSQFAYVYNDPRYISPTATYNPGHPVYGTFWEEFEKVMRAMSQGVKDASRPAGADAPQAWFGIGFSVLNRYRDPFCGDFTFVRECGGGNSATPDERMEWRCVISYLPKRLNQPGQGYATPAPIDYWSYSSYDSTRTPLLLDADLNVAKRVRDDLTNILGWMNLGRGQRYEANSLIIGELGFSNNTIAKSPARMNEGESYSARFLRETMEAFKAFGVSYVIYFQGADAISPTDFLCATDYALFTGASAFLDTVFVPTATGEAFARSATADETWIEDRIPTAKQAYPYGDWQELTAATAPRPVSGTTAFGTALHEGPPLVYAYYFDDAPEAMPVGVGDTLFAYVYLDPAHPPGEIMLQWKAGSEHGDWEHRAYWGGDLIHWGVDGAASRRRIGDLPPAGRWVRLEVPANIVGLENRLVRGFSLTISNGRAAFDRVGRTTGEFIWADDAIAGGQRGVFVGSTCGCAPYRWGEIASDPWPISGAKAFQTGIVDGDHTQFFHNATPMRVDAGDSLFAYVYLDPAHPSETVILQWRAVNGDWGHRAYWGAAKIPWGEDGTAGSYYLGPLPPPGQWVRLEVPADVIGLGGKEVDGFGLGLFRGRAAWDRVGKRTRDLVWLDDEASIPQTHRFEGGGDGWNRSSIAAPASGQDGFQTIAASGLHQIFTAGLPNTLTVNPGDSLLAYVYLDPDPDNRPRTLMFQWNDGDWEHRAYWGEDNLIPWGDRGPLDLLFNSLYLSVNLSPPNYHPGSASYRFMGALPPTGKWVRLEVPASRVGLEGRTLNGFAFTLYGGRGVFDRVGKVRNEHLDD